VKPESAVIDLSHKIGSEKGHRDIQRYASQDDPDYRDVVGWIQKWVEEEAKRIEEEKQRNLSMF
jgi:hypothetical protein